MKGETKIWIGYAHENLESARILLSNNLLNPCLQNVQQSVEKLLKALLVEFHGKLIKTHSIVKLRQMVELQGLNIDISEDDCDLLDTIYLPSKYPIESVIPDYLPDALICNRCIDIARRVEKSVTAILKEKDPEI